MYLVHTLKLLPLLLIFSVPNVRRKMACFCLAFESKAVLFLAVALIPLYVNKNK